jgi:hypothetical protein
MQKSCKNGAIIDANQQHLALNMEKTRITHLNDGFTFLGHRLVRKRGPRGTMRVVQGGTGLEVQ